MASSVRSGMARLIAKTRLLIGDQVVAGSAPQFSELDIQDALDRRRLDVRYEALAPQVTFTTGPYQYLDYYSEHGYYEDAVTLLGPNYATLTPTSSELLLDEAHFVFPAGSGQTGQYPPVWLAGRSYDLYGSAADLLETWAGSFARQYDFTADGATFRRSQMGAGLLAQAQAYRAKARIRMVSTGRDDAATGDDQRSALLGPVSSGVWNATGE